MKPKVHQPIAELLFSDETELPEDLRRKIHGTRKRDEETTQVTKLMEELEECAAAAKAELNKTGRIAGRVSRMTRNSKSYSNLKLSLVPSPPPPTVEGDA